MMPLNTRAFYFARLSLLPHVTGSKREEAVQTGLDGPHVSHLGDHWSFLDVETVEVSSSSFLCGYLARYEPDAEEQVADEKKRRILTQELKNVITAKAPFYLHVGTDENILAFHPVPKITENQFRTQFINLYKKAHGDFFVEPWLESITDTFAIWEALQTFESVYRFKVHLHRPNPTMREEWRKIAQDLIDKNASEYREEYIADEKSSGLNLQEDHTADNRSPSVNTETQAKIRMAEDGYGEATIVGRRKGKKARASTKDLPVKADVPKSEETHKGVVTVLLDKFHDLWDRFE